MSRKTGLRRIDVDGKHPVFTTQTEWGDANRLEFGEDAKDCPNCGRKYGKFGLKSYYKHILLCDGKEEESTVGEEAAPPPCPPTKRKSTRPRNGAARPTVASIAHRHVPTSVFDGNTNHFQRHGPTHTHSVAISRLPVHTVDRVVEPQMTTNHCTNCGRNLPLDELRGHMEWCFENHTNMRKAPPAPVSLPLVRAPTPLDLYPRTTVGPPSVAAPAFNVKLAGGTAWFAGSGQ